MRRWIAFAVVIAVTVTATLWAGTLIGREREYRRLIADGEAALSADQHFKAVEALSGAIALRPDLMIAHAKRGETYLRLGEPAAALRDLIAAVDLDPSALRPIELLGDANMALERYARAAERYQEYLALDELEGRVRYKLGLAQYRAGNLPAAIAALRLAVSYRSRFAEAHYLLGVCLREQSQLTDAVAALERAVALAPGLMVAREALAEVYLRLERGRDAVVQLEELTAQDPGRPERHVAVGLAYAAAGMRDAAVVALRRAAQRFPEQPVVYTALGRVWLEDADQRGGDRIAVKKAIEALGAVAAPAAATSETLTLYGRALMLDGRVTAAERAFQRATIRYPVDRSAFLLLAQSAERLGHVATARDALAQHMGLTDEASRRPTDAVRVAELSMRLAEPAVAVTWIRRALPRCGDDAPLLSRLAEVAVRAGDIDSARTAVSKGLAADPASRSLLALKRRLDGR